MSRFASVQEAVSLTHAKLVDQGYRCVNGAEPAWASVCLYGDSKGGHCAVGMWLSPSSMESALTFEGSVASLLQLWPEITQDLTIDGLEGEELVSFWTAMQFAHDDLSGWDAGMFKSPLDLPLFRQSVLF